MSTKRASAARRTGFNGFDRQNLGKLSACAVAVSALLNGAALAQDPTASDEITVTGTRIQRSAVDTPVPVTRVSSDELEQMTPGTLIEALTALPQFYDNIQPDQITGGQTGGGANLNLRGAGVNRSLILLEGRRVVPSNRFGTVDVSAFPEELVSRVETVTGGASASYGTDAVSGVVNFILDTDYEGFKLHSQAGSTDYGDGESFEIGGAFGTDIGERMHIIGSLEGYRSDAIDTFDALKDRGFYRQSARVTNTTPGGPAEIIRPYVSPTNFTNGGIIIQTGSALDRTEFLADGSFRTLPFSGVGQVNGGCNCQAEPTQSPSYGVDSDEQIAPEYERISAFVHFDYDISENLNFYAQGLFGQTENSDRRESIAVLSLWQAQIFANNVFLPQAIRNQMAAENRQFVGFGFFGVNGPQTPIGDARQITDNELSSTTVGFRMNLERDGFLDGWELDGYYQHGKNVQDYITENGIRVDRLFFALDAVAGPGGAPVCNIALVNPALFGDCVPVNLFGGVHMISPAAAAYIVDDGKTARQDTQQEVVEVVFTGELGDGFGAGPISAAFGASYRDEELWQKTLDPSDEFPAQVNGTLLSDQGVLPAGIRGLIPQGHVSGLGIPGLRHVPSGFLGDSNSSSVLFSSLREISGGFDVREVFAEFAIPLVSGKTLVQQFDLDLAARWADYSGSGSVQAWKAGVNWQATDGIRVRATRSQDTRAATLRERFDQTRGGVNVQDPLNNNATVTTASFSGGNPNVQPEEAQTVTVGLVFQPPQLSGFSVSADWYEIDINDAINQLSGQAVVTGCTGTAVLPPDPALCQYVIRDPAVQPPPQGAIVRVENLFINLARQVISGVDLELNYTTGVGDGTLGWRLFATRLNENSTQNRGEVRDERAGQVAGGISLPDNKVTTSINYSQGPFSVFVQGRWIDGGILDRTRREGVGAFTIDDNSVDSVFYTDLNASYTITGQRQWEIFLNVTNLLDEEPPLAAQIVGRTGTNEFNTALHDVLGRRFVAGFNLEF
jgi:outer membrane receptor protein involved in Fe transport